MRNNDSFKYYDIQYAPSTYSKITIIPKGLSKINSISNYFNQPTILITDYEQERPVYNDMIKIYSVGTNEDFNKYCNKSYLPDGIGILKILKEKEKIYNEKIRNTFR